MQTLLCDITKVYKRITKGLKAFTKLVLLLRWLVVINQSIAHPCWHWQTNMITPDPGGFVWPSIVTNWPTDLFATLSATVPQIVLLFSKSFVGKCSFLTAGQLLATIGNDDVIMWTKNLKKNRITTKTCTISKLVSKIQIIAPHVIMTFVNQN